MHQNQSIGSWIIRRAARTPGRVALVHGRSHHTYRDLAERVTRLAHVLRDHGVGRGDRVAVLGSNHPAHLEAFFACGLLGAILVPVHPAFDDDAWVRVLEAAECSAAVLTDGDALARMGRLRPRLSIPHLWATVEPTPWAAGYEGSLDRASAEALDVPVDLDDLAILGFTSGTTGDNKGVMLTHGNLAFNVFNLLSAIDYTSDDVMLLTAPLYRMGGLGFVLPILFEGGRCILPDDRTPATLLRMVERHRVTFLFDTPPVAEALARDEAFGRADLSSVRMFVVGGDALREDLVHVYLHRGIPLLQGYGLTEAAPVVLMLDPADVETQVGSVGRPPLFCSIRVVDEDLRDLPPGEVGELLVHGPNVMRGYWRRPDATARALTPDGWLRTGDAVRRDERGNVIVVARAADVMRRGRERFYPQWIERVVAERVEVAECAAVQPTPDARPVVLVVPAVGARLNCETLLATCRDALPPTWTPADVVEVDTLPRNANGKLLRQGLAALVRAATARSGDTRTAARSRTNQATSRP